MKRQAYSGFTLIELMIVVVVISILVAFAMPSYRQYVMKSRRADAKAGLINLQLNMEKYRTSCIRYPGGLTNSPPDVCDQASSTYTVRNSSTSPDGYYNLSIVSPTAFTYELRASPVSGSPQAGDKCGNFYINQNNVKWVTSYASGFNTSQCW